MDYVLWLVIWVGHLAVWCVIFNRVHATAFPRRFRKLTEKFVIVAVVGGYLWFLVTAIVKGSISVGTFADVFVLNRVYLILCVIAGLYFTLRWIYRKFFVPPVGAILEHSTDVINVAATHDGPVYVSKIAKLLQRIPGNQSHLIAIERMTFGITNLPERLEGLKVCHLSDFHLTGHIDIGYYKKIVQEVNAFGPDFVFITGDLIDEAKCLDWLGEVFGEFQSRHGVFYVLGNHDKRIPDETMLRKRLDELGLISVNGRWHTIEVNDATILIAGNELPWYRGAENLQDYQEPDVSKGAALPLKILLSHSPDQLVWAKPLGFDLMLAGHTHGGQIQIPIVGPIVAPSRFGIKYASGTFMIDSMLMHVSRGIAGDECIRINCKPEVGFFTLKCQRGGT